MSMSEVEKVTVTLRVPSTLSAYSGGKSQITLEAGTVEEMLTALHVLRKGLFVSMYAYL